MQKMFMHNHSFTETESAGHESTSNLILDVIVCVLQCYVYKLPDITLFNVLFLFDLRFQCLEVLIGLEVGGRGSF